MGKNEIYSKYILYCKHCMFLLLCELHLREKAGHIGSEKCMTCHA